MYHTHNNFKKLNEKINSNEHVKSFFQNLKNYKFDGFESSVKVTKDRVYTDRFLVIQNKSDHAKNDMLTVLPRITTNSNLIQKCKSQYSLCDRYGFAIEVSDKVNYRIYFETDMTSYRKEVVARDGRDRTVTITGYRWNSGEDHNYVTTEYSHLLDISKSNIKSELSKLELKYVPAYFDQHELLRFYTVKEDKTKRNSLCFQLKNFTVDSLREEMTSLNKDATIHIDEYGKTKTSNISYGIDKNGNLFYTHYFLLYNAVYS